MLRLKILDFLFCFVFVFILLFSNQLQCQFTQSDEGCVLELKKQTHHFLVEQQHSQHFNGKFEDLIFPDNVCETAQ